MTKSKPDSDKAISRLEEAAGHYAAEKQMQIYPALHPCDELRIRGTIEAAYIDAAKWLLAEAEKMAYGTDAESPFVYLVNLKELAGE